MNFILGGILIVLTLILVVLCISIFKSDSTPKSLWSPELQAKIDATKEKGDDLQKFAAVMIAKLDEEKRLQQEQEMMQYAQSKIKDKPLLPSSTNERNPLTNVRSQAKELVPFNMSPQEKALWEEFNS